MPTSKGLAHCIIPPIADSSWAAPQYKLNSAYCGSRNAIFTHPTTIMSAAIVLPSLTNWTKNGISAIFRATNQVDFKSAVDGFLSDKAKITLNGVHVSRADFVNRLQADKFDEEGAVVTFNDSVEVPKDTQSPVSVSTSVVLQKSWLTLAFPGWGPSDSSTTRPLLKPLKSGMLLSPPK